MNQLIAYLKNHSVHNEKLAIVRFLLALGMLLTFLFNDMNVIASHSYTGLADFKVRHSLPLHGIMKRADLFMIMPPAAGKIVAIIILLIVMSGYLPRISGLLHLWLCYSFHNYFLIKNGGDMIAYILSILLLPICLTDPRINQWQKNADHKGRSNIVANIAYFSIHIQAALLYLDAGLSKISVPEWKDGTAVYYYTSHYNLGAPGWLQKINEAITLTPLVKVITWGVLAFELLMPLCLFANNKIKRVFLIMGLSFHLLIAIDLGLITFFLTMSALLILYLDDENNSVKLLHRILPKKKV